MFQEFPGVVSEELNRMRVLYFGDPLSACILLTAGVEIAGIIHGRKGGVGWRRLFKILASRKEPIPRWHRPDLHDPLVADAIADTRPSLIVSSFYPELIPSHILALAPGLNVHPSDLPQWRGPDPVTHTILSGQTNSAICVHALTETLDAGDIYRRHCIEIEPRAEAGSLSLRLERIGAELVAQTAIQWLREGEIKGEPQVGQVTWAPQRSEEWWEIDWHKSAQEVDRFIRAAHPFPGAYTGIGDELLVIHKANAAEADGFETLPPATPFIRKRAIYIRCGDGALRLQRVRLGRRVLTGTQFAQLLL